MHKSIDGGDTWTEITRNEGLPQGIIGINCITVSPKNPDRLWAMRVTSRTITGSESPSDMSKASNMTS